MRAFQRAVIPERGEPLKRLELVPDTEGLKGVFCGYVRQLQISPPAQG